MSIGVGIVIATLVLVVAWQVDKRGAWAKFRRFALWSVAVVVLLGAAGIGYLWWDGGKYKREQAVEAKKARAGELRSYWGIALGMDANEVEYLKGKPTKVIDFPPDGSVGWSYETPDAAAPPDYPASGGYVVWIDPDGKVSSIQCYASEAHYCEVIAGVGRLSGEREIAEQLGPPQRGPRVKDGRKEIGYGTKAAFLIFSLEQDRVQLIHVGGGDSEWFTGLPENKDPH